ncbi:ATP-grasp domain-containing protein [Streptomyces sp. H27-D2]|uniref:ATP-grasp domain-containing protein n=1 Tax=Streptomyces sp. H27-D2 TaxID=3046304 RepID=UPI002DB666AF|nr:ATP-grasp domain-containing protein [Streptomyces sp. H27-D2]MEC4018632.1 ATP-grasp domain-containing protein [Streptomyces sp. H27-D2]
MSKVLFVYAKGGPPLEYALSRVAAKAEVHLLALSALPPSVRDACTRLCASVVVPSEARARDLVALIMDRARSVGADAVMTVSEYAVVAVADACERLGLAGSGGNCVLARDKRMMRRTWSEHGVSQPRFHSVASEDDLRDAARTLSFPMLLKAAWSAGSTAHRIIRSPNEVGPAWDRAREVMAESAGLGYAELHVEGAGADFLVEEIVHGDAEGWFADAGWGDYVSVEGVVADGVYHPICLSGRMPTIEPFTERASITPAPLPAAAQERVVALSRAAVDALGLENCGTHTEIKLGSDGRMWVIETAARFGGAMTVPQIEDVFALDLIGLLADQLLGRDVSWPAEVLGGEQARHAAGSLVVLAVDGDGAPWPDRRAWDFDAVDWPSLLSPGSRLSEVTEHSLPRGSTVPVYDPAAGANTMAALCLLSAARPVTVIRDFEALTAAFPGVLPAAAKDGGA